MLIIIDFSLKNSIPKTKGEAMKVKFLFVLAIIMLISSCSNTETSITAPEKELTSSKASTITMLFDFNATNENWDGGFSDMPIDSDWYNLDFTWKRAPGKMGSIFGKALYITGDNHSDDLFMFVKKQVTGLLPNTTYQLNFNFDIINDIPEGLFGIGGSPGESVFMKFGAVNYEPIAVLNETQTAWFMNIDKGNQSQSGTEMHNIGTVANPNVNIDKPRYAAKNFDSYLIGFDFQVTTDANGTAWVIIGTDSGFEGTTEVYYDNITVIFDEVVL